MCWLLHSRSTPNALLRANRAARLASPGQRLYAQNKQVDQSLVEFTGKATRVWEVLFFHEPGKVQVWLATHCWASPANLFNGIRVTLYGLPELSVHKQQLNIAFGPALLLAQASVSNGPLHRNQLARVTTEWQVSQPAQDLKFSLRLQNVRGESVYTQDYVPQNWFAPTRVWIVGQPAVDQRGILLPPNLADGRYRVTLRLYDPVSGAAVETTAGQNSGPTPKWSGQTASPPLRKGNAARTR